MTSHIDSLVPIWKPIGLTPLECVEEYRHTHPEFDGTTISYAGRLDPMAEGVLLLLVGEANKRRREYEHLAKEYEVDVLCGFTTDTGDLMGRITSMANDQIVLIDEDARNVLRLFVGEREQKYPAYSSVKVQGKPLYWWARQGRVGEIEIPSHTVRIDSITLFGITDITKEELEQYIVENISKVKGDFRQDEIIQVWGEVLKTALDERFQMMKIKLACGSGAYMRVLAEDIGQMLGTPACAFHIKRMRVGDYSI